jgi:RHS repeat-associated protein
VDGRRLIERFTGPGCATCPPANTRWVVDEHGRTTETIQLNAQGQPLLGERQALDDWGRVKAVLAVSYRNGRQHSAVQTARFEYLAPFEPGVADATQPTLIARASVVPGQEHVTRIAYNAHGQPTQITEAGYSPVDGKGELNATPITRSTTYSYSRLNGRSLLTTIDGPLPNGPKNTSEDSDITTLAWDARGSMVVATVQPAGFTTEVRYDDAGRLQQVRNDEGAASVYRFNAAGQLASLARSSRGGHASAAQVQTFSYDAHGRLIETGPGHGSNYKAKTHQAWDGADRLLWQASAIGWAQQWQRDAEGRLLSQANISPAIVQSTAYEWRDDGSLSAVSDNAGRRVVVPSTAPAAAAQPSAAQPSSVRAEPVEAAERTTHLADDFGRVVRTQSPDSGTVIRSFDAADRLTAMRDALANEAQYTYDAAGRIVQQAVQAKGQTPVLTQWRYQGRQLAELIHPTQSERYTYNANGWRQSKTVTVGGFTSTTRYEHDSQGELLATTLPDGSRIAYARNGQGQVTALTRSRVHTPWLRRFETPQTLARDFERDAIGLTSYTAGNGVQARFMRSREGSLARVVYRKPAPAMTAQGQTTLLGFVGQNSQDTFERLLGIAPVYAQQPSASLLPAGDKTQGGPGMRAGAQPGALGHPTDPQALIDHRYLWDARGNLLLDAQRAGAPTDSAYAYDGANRLVIASTQGTQAAPSGALQPVSQSSAQRTDAAPQTSFYFHDAQGRRVLAQDQGAATRRIAYDGSTHRWSTDADVQAEYDESGQPTAIGARRFTWDAHGRLLTVSENNKPLATYTYNHRGQRIEKKTGAQPTQFLYDDHGQVQAELNANGAITRQYVYAADLPIAVIDGSTALHQDGSAWIQAFIDVGHLLRSWIGKADHTAWLHTNHLGAPEAATDAKGQLLWQASYNASGRAKTTSSVRPELVEGPSLFTLNLRLPGQYADAETGLHYNAHRYYDPERGQYLSPDPLASSPGYPDGPNPYAYVRYNPLRYVDPQGLVLFAFDGTNNTNDPNDLRTLGNGISNVWHFRELYQDGDARYITGVGTEDRSDPARLIRTNGTDAAFSNTGLARVDRMMEYFREELALARERNARDNTDVSMDIDIVGFSRGASQAREFSNRITMNSVWQGSTGRGAIPHWLDGLVRLRDANGVERLYYRTGTYVTNPQAGTSGYVYRCQRVNFRFMGLWDTVLSTHRGTYNLDIPPQFAHVAHAIALNEYRGMNTRQLPGVPLTGRLGAFPLESIMGGTVPAGQTRIERGFVGAHADIGGGFPDQGDENALARVALSWMVQQARSVRVNMRDLPNNTVPASPVIHDKSEIILTGGMGAGEDRQVRYRDNRTTTQRQMTGTGLTFAEIARRQADARQRFIEFDANRGRTDAITGTVNACRYLDWLRNNGYDIGNLRAQGCN